MLAFSIIKFIYNSLSNTIYMIFSSPLCVIGASAYLHNGYYRMPYGGEKHDVPISRLPFIYVEVKGLFLNLSSH